MIEVKVSFDTDAQQAKELTRHWAALALSPEEKMGVEDPIEMERRADALPLDRAASRWIVSSDPDEQVERIRPYVELGFTPPRVPCPRPRPGALPEALRRAGRAAAAQGLWVSFDAVPTSRNSTGRMAAHAGRLADASAIWPAACRWCSRATISTRSRSRRWSTRASRPKPATCSSSRRRSSRKPRTALSMSRPSTPSAQAIDARRARPARTRVLSRSCCRNRSASCGIART